MCSLGYADNRRSSPRPWGCFSPRVIAREMEKVFPTPVGVFPTMSLTLPMGESLPHARGGVSIKGTVCSDQPKSSPRPWGCFHPLLLRTRQPSVFPTPVGVFLETVGQFILIDSLPHARGGVSMPGIIGVEKGKSSPRPWGCFCWRFRRVQDAIVFPTPVGVFRYIRRSHVVSVVFPTPVGVFPASRSRRSGWTCLPHARGGVSRGVHMGFKLSQSSPRPWGCFRR